MASITITTTPWSEKVALITGSSSGIGRGLALALADRNVKLALAALEPDLLQKVKEECLSRMSSSSAEQVLVLQTDLADPKEPERLVQETLKAFGRLDYVVPNAGVWKPGGLEETTLGNWDLTMNVNLRSTFLLIQASLEPLKATGGNVLVTSSILGKFVIKGSMAYVVSKHALCSLVKVAALEHGKDGLRINAMCPGNVQETGFTVKSMPDQSASKSFLGGEVAMTPMEQPTTIQQVVDGMLFLLSDSASFITGQLLAVDGGRSIMQQLPPNY